VLGIALASIAGLPVAARSSGTDRGLLVRPPWGAVRAAGPNAARTAGAQPWLQTLRERERRWRSFPDLVVHPSREWVPHFGARRGVRAPFENMRPAGAGAGAPRAQAAPQVIRLAFIRVEFETDRGGNASTGTGRFDLSEPGNASAPIDRPPHNRKFYLDHLEALHRYYHAQSYGAVDIQGEVWPRKKADGSPADSLAYRVSDMADFGPWAFGSSIYPAAAHMFRTFLLAADAQARVLGDSIPWRDYDGLVIIHAGSDLQSDVRQDSKEDIPTFTLGVADSDRVVFPNAYKDCPADTADTLAAYCPIGEALFVPETANQDGFYGAINGLLAHECGHLLFGFADLYDIETGIPVVGLWSLMDSGNLAGAPVVWEGQGDIFATGILPPSIDPFQRSFVGGALQFEEVAYDGASTQILDGERHPDMRAIPLSSDEYLLMENRALARLDTLVLVRDTVTNVVLGPAFPDPYEYDALLPGGGILVWHIDASVLTYSTSLRVNGDFGWNTNRRRLGVSVIEADGLADLGDLGSPLLFGSYRDPYYRSNNPTLSDTTLPSLIPNTRTRPHLRLDFLDEPDDTMHFSARRAWQLPGWPVAADFPPGGPQLLAVDADGVPDLEVCWAGGDTAGAGANDIFVVRRNGLGILGSSLALTTLSDRPRPPLAALPRGAGGQGPSLLAVSTYARGGSGGQVLLIDADPANAGQPWAGWPPASSPVVSTPPVFAGAFPVASVLVGGADGYVYAYNLNGSVVARSRDPLPGAVSGRLAVAAASSIPLPAGGTTSGWLVAAGDSIGDVAVWALDGSAVMTPLSGWPQRLATRTDFAPDFLWLDFDGAGSAGGNPSGCRAGLPELVAHETTRLWAFCAEGSPLRGWGRENGDTLVGALGAGDPDGDGFPEVLTQTRTSKVAFVNLSGYPSPGWPRAGSPEGVLGEDSVLTEPRAPRRFPTLSPPLALDVNGDGRSEIVAPNTSGMLAALDAAGATPEGWPLATGSGAGGSAVAADLDGDGLLEIVAPDRFGQLFAYSLPVPAAPLAAHPWRMLGGDAQRTSSLPASGLSPTPPPSAGPLVRGSLKAFPNPARRKPVSFAYQLSEPARVEFRILDSSGHEVASFSRGGERADNLEVWDPGSLPAGLYLARLKFSAAGREEVQVLPLGIIR
jgi:M6 family metalloprotease-like protein